MGSSIENVGNTGGRGQNAIKIYQWIEVKSVTLGNGVVQN